MAIISNAVTIADAGAFSVSLGSQVLIKEITASADASIQFVHGTDGVVLDSTYPIYKIDIINSHGSANDKNFQINFSTDGGSNYNVVKTTTGVITEHGEDDSPSGSLFYNVHADLAQSTDNQVLGYNGGTDGGDSTSGSIYLFNPSSTTYVKHFISHTNIKDYTDDCRTLLIAGYCNTTSAVNAVRFTFISANVDDGIFKLYGIKDS
jgi:hypothetical protein